MTFILKDQKAYKNQVGWQKGLCNNRAFIAAASLFASSAICSYTLLSLCAAALKA